MNKIFAKIVLLILCLVMIGSMVLFFAKKHIESPKKITYENLFINKVNQDIASLNEQNSYSLYHTIMYKVKFQYQEEKISPEARNVLAKKFIDKYISFFKIDMRKAFNSCNKNKIEYLQQRLDQLTAFGDTSQHTEYINKIKSDFKIMIKAEQFSNNISFTNLSNAKEQIETSRNYLEKEPIRTCEHIVIKLQNVPRELEAQHYNYLERKIHSLAYCDEDNESGYNELIRTISQEIEEYRKNASSTYGYIRDVEPLLNIARDYVSQAYEKCYNHYKGYEE